MHTPDPPSPAARDLAGPALAAALRDARAQSLLHLSRWRSAAGPDGRLPLHPHFNPPAWEAGHVAWFQEYWIARNPQRSAGELADPDCSRHAGRLDGADAHYDSGRVPHDLRWSLALPDPVRLSEYLEQTLADTLALLAVSGSDDRALYFHRLALFHEDMHNEAAIYMANHYGSGFGADTLVFAPATSAAPAATSGARELFVPAGEAILGREGTGFAFDNERPARHVRLDAFDIDRRLVSVAEYWAFVAADGYRDQRWWSPEGWRDIQTRSAALPRFCRERSGAVERCCFGHWRTLDPREPVMHVNAHEAEAWCRWAGRTLPSEAQWLRAAATCPGFAWGEAWEWTGEAFNAFPGFIAHPYRDYSRPWFGDRRLLKGASPATNVRLRDVAYRNFYLPSRSDILCGFRSCSGQAQAA